MHRSSSRGRGFGARAPRSFFFTFRPPGKGQAPSLSGTKRSRRRPPRPESRYAARQTNGEHSDAGSTGISPAPKIGRASLSKISGTPPAIADTAALGDLSASAGTTGSPGNSFSFLPWEGLFSEFQRVSPDRRFAMV